MVSVGWSCDLCAAIGVVEIADNPGAAVAAEHRAISPSCTGRPRPAAPSLVEMWTDRRLIALALQGRGPARPVRRLADLILFADAR